MNCYRKITRFRKRCKFSRIKKAKGLLLPEFSFPLSFPSFPSLLFPGRRFPARLSPGKSPHFPSGNGKQEEQTPETIGGKKKNGNGKEEGREGKEKKFLLIEKK